MFSATLVQLPTTTKVPFDKWSSITTHKLTTQISVSSSVFIMHTIGILFVASIVTRIHAGLPPWYECKSDIQMLLLYEHLPITVHLAQFVSIFENSCPKAALGSFHCPYPSVYGMHFITKIVFCLCLLLIHLSSCKYLHVRCVKLGNEHLYVRLPLFWRLPWFRPTPFSQQQN